MPWPGALAAIQQLQTTMQGSSSSKVQDAVTILETAENVLLEELVGMGLTFRSRSVLCAISKFAKGLPHFAAISIGGLTWAPLAQSLSVGQQVFPAAAVAAQATAAGKQQARQAAAAAASQPSEATAAHQLSKATTTAGTRTSLGGVAAKRLAEAEATPSAEKRLKAAITNSQQLSRATSVGFALRDPQGREYVTVAFRQPAYLTLSQAEPVPDLVEVYNSRCSSGAPLLASTCGLFL